MQAEAERLGTPEGKGVADPFDYADFFEHAPDMFAAVNLDTGKIIYCNATLPLKLGYEKQDLLGKPLEWISHSSSHAAIASLISDLKCQRSEVQREITLKTRTGGRILTALKSKAMQEKGDGVSVGNLIWREISNFENGEDKAVIHQQVMEVLEASKKFYASRKSVVPLFKKILTSILDITGSEYGFISEILHQEDGTPYLKSQFVSDISWNQETKELYDEYFELGLELYNLNTLFGRVILTGEFLISNDPKNDPWSGGIPEGHPELKCFLGVPIKFENDFVGMVGLANKPSGYTKQDLETLTPIISACGFLLNSYKNYQQKVEAEEQSKENLRRLAISNQNLEELAQVAAHDLRAPLRKIRNFCYFAGKNQSQLPEEVKIYLNKIEAAADDGEKLIEAVLEYSKPDFSKMPHEEIDLGPIVEEAFNSSREEHFMEAELVCGSLPVILGNRTQISQVFYNLISNSFMYRQEGIPLRIEVEGSSVSDTEWVVKIRDNGMGFEPEANEIIFDPFQRLYHPPRKGSGLGLAICKKIISSHKGRIRAEGKVGKGATFFIHLPRIP